MGGTPMSRRPEEPPGGWTDADRVPEGQQRTRASARRPDEIVIQRATKYRPYEVIKRSGRWYVRNTRDGRTTGPYRRAEALGAARIENDRAPAPVEHVSRGAGIQKTRRGEWQVVDVDGTPTPMYAPTKREAIERVHLMWRVRDMTAEDNATA
ncbi:hypothetical protein [Marinactinospora rubrisoli]|uniref:Uncharacterized protein n=1 Tax=Marinactinospora rubrisoli TaxID=2715399 RepID=A0ABW2KMX6_9ACTN